MSIIYHIFKKQITISYESEAIIITEKKLSILYLREKNEKMHILNYSGFYLISGFYSTKLNHAKF